MIPIPAGPLQTPLFAENVPVEFVLRLAHLLCGREAEPTAEEQALDAALQEMLAMDLYHRGADYREIPWPLRLQIVRLTGHREGLRNRPKAP